MNKKGKIRLWSFITNGNKRSSECRTVFAEFPWIFLVCKYNGQRNDWKVSVLFLDLSRKRDQLRVELPEETADISWFTTGFPAKWRHSVEIRHCLPVITQTWVVLMMGCHKRNLPQAMRNTTQFCEVIRHQYGISTVVPLTSFRGETIGVVIWPFSQATHWISTLTVYFSTLSGRLDTQPLWFLLQNIFQRTGLVLSKGNLRGTGIKSCYSELTG